MQYKGLHVDMIRSVCVILLTLTTTTLSVGPGRGSCPNGYVEEIGDVPNWGHRDLGSKLWIPSRWQCARKCTALSGCLSFEHSNTEKYCNLNNIAMPTPRAYKDYAFCRKYEPGTCPSGYKLEIGDVPNWGHRDLGSKLWVPSRWQCARRCTALSGCLSFEHSNTEKYCNLNNVAMPTAKAYKNYAFCTKSVNGGWTNFGSWSECTKTCGTGTQSRNRTCTNPAPQYGGADCTGDAEESRDCNTQPCPIDGGWSSFGSYSECTKTCGTGTQSRNRTCTNPAPKYGGADCTGDAEESRDCNTQPCPINGGWTNFGSWSECTKTCGKGLQTRTRTCTNPAPKYGGADCTGNAEERKYCNYQSCWNAVKRGVSITHDLETSSFYLKTNSFVGSDQVAKVYFLDSAGRDAGGIVFAFTKPPQYHVRLCDGPGRTNYPTAFPSKNGKVWKITMTRSGSNTWLEVLCNKEKILNLRVSSSTCKFSSWKGVWSRSVSKIKFPSDDTASDFYSTNDPY